MLRVSALVVVLVVVVLALYATGCTKKQPVDQGLAVGPIEPLPDEPGPIEPGAAGEYTYVCPEHPDQTSHEPGKCPICEAYMEADTEDEVEYYCPDHPEFVQDEPGEHEGVALVARPKAAVIEEPVVEDEVDLGEDTTEEDSSVEEAAPEGAPTEI